MQLERFLCYLRNQWSPLLRALHVTLRAMEFLQFSWINYYYLFLILLFISLFLRQMPRRVHY